MKFISSTFITLALSALAAVAIPATNPENELEKRAEKCRIILDGAQCKRTPSSSDTIGEFFIGDACLSLFDAPIYHLGQDYDQTPKRSGAVLCVGHACRSPVPQRTPSMLIAFIREAH
ncbi:hypothetical protein C8R45DRAFT_935838 [Mycena sanguinolenta]|nr:hypothetical protein C8R45DRAFT_935838 [Mycena sanguinolenta]